MFKRTVFFMLILACISITNAGDLNKPKMEKVTKEILDVFADKNVSDNTPLLRKFISNEWLDKKKINVNDYNINSYGPDNYNIIYTGGDVCIALIGGSSWSHLLVFKFTEEGNFYRVIPGDIVSVNYINPWWHVEDYLCSNYKDNEK